MRRNLEIYRDFERFIKNFDFCNFVQLYVFHKYLFMRNNSYKQDLHLKYLTNDLMLKTITACEFAKFCKY